MSDITPEAPSTDLGSIEGTAGGAESTDLGEITVTEIQSEAAGLTVVPLGEIEREDVGTFSVRYNGTVPQLVSGGSIVPSLISVVDGSGKVVAEYTARAVDPAATPPKARALPIDQNQLVGCAGPNCKPISLRS
ncbi:hypothetical protein [Nocardia sp. NPDC050175]|uniref:hypothetical protein n=1 Tax=Nocardia sp. NPDC050175 TaxID=3364317 RepID=UPI0037964CFE